MSFQQGKPQLQLSVDSFTPLSSDLIVYELSVTYGSQHWTIKYRYSKYKELHDELKRTHRHLPAFPPKWLFTHTDPKHLETRRRDLDVYMKSLAAIPSVTTHPEMLNFIDLSSHLRRTEPLPTTKPFFSQPTTAAPDAAGSYAGAGHVPPSLHRAPSPPRRTHIDMPTTAPISQPRVLPPKSRKSLDDFDISSDDSPPFVLLNVSPDGALPRALTHPPNPPLSQPQPGPADPLATGNHHPPGPVLEDLSNFLASAVEFKEGEDETTGAPLKRVDSFGLIIQEEPTPLPVPAPLLAANPTQQPLSPEETQSRIPHADSFGLPLPRDASWQTVVTPSLKDDPDFTASVSTLTELAFLKSKTPPTPTDLPLTQSPPVLPSQSTHQPILSTPPHQSADPSILPSLPPDPSVLPSLPLDPSILPSLPPDPSVLSSPQPHLEPSILTLPSAVAAPSQDDTGETHKETTGEMAASARRRRKDNRQAHVWTTPPLLSSLVEDESADKGTDSIPPPESFPQSLPTLSVIDQPVTNVPPLPAVVDQPAVSVLPPVEITADPVFEPLTDSSDASDDASSLSNHATTPALLPDQPVAVVSLLASSSPAIDSESIVEQPSLPPSLDTPTPTTSPLTSSPGPVFADSPLIIEPVAGSSSSAIPFPQSSIPLVDKPKPASPSQTIIDPDNTPIPKVLTLHDTSFSLVLDHPLWLRFLHLLLFMVVFFFKTTDPLSSKIPQSVTLIFFKFIECLATIMIFIFSKVIQPIWDRGCYYLCK